MQIEKVKISDLSPAEYNPRVRLRPGDAEYEKLKRSTMKPITLIGKLIKNSSRINEKVLDLFGGSGSTLIAAEQLKRRAYIMELDEKFCDVIVKRWEDFTGEKAVKVKC